MLRGAAHDGLQCPSFRASKGALWKVQACPVWPCDVALLLLDVVSVKGEER